MNTKTLGRKIAKVVAFALMAVIVFVGGVTTSELLREKEQQSVIKGTGNSLQAEQTINNGISMMAADGSDYVGNTLGQSVPYGALKVTATVTPAEASNKKLSWSCAWAGTTGWSSGKTVSDYFKLEYIGTNAHEIYVWATAAFGDQVKVTATSTDGSNKTATMTVDFAKRMNGLTEMAMSEDGDCPMFGWFDCSTREFHQDDTIQMKPGPTLEDFAYTSSYTDGTKNLTWNLVDFKIDYDEEFRNAVEQVFGYETRSSATYSSGEIGYESVTHNIWDGTDADLALGDENSTEKWVELAMLLDYTGNAGGLTFYFESASTNALGNKYTYSITFEIILDYGGLLPVSNVALSDSSLTI